MLPTKLPYVDEALTWTRDHNANGHSLSNLLSISQQTGANYAGILVGIHNVRDYGATGDGVTDDTQAFKDAIAGAGRGIIWIPAGDYILTDTLALTSHGSSLIGAGAESNSARPTWLDFSGLAGGKDAISAIDLDNITLKGFYVTGPGAGLTNSGIVIKGDPGVTSGHLVEGIIVSAFGDTTHAGYAFELGMIASTVRNCICAGGYYGFHLLGSSTSTSFISCYSLNAAISGYRIGEATYIALVSCASDGSGGAGYSLSAPKQVSMVGCGAESCDEEAVSILGAASGITLLNFRSHGNKLDTNKTDHPSFLFLQDTCDKITVIDCQDSVPSGAQSSVLGGTTGTQILIIHPDFDNGIHENVGGTVIDTTISKVGAATISAAQWGYLGALDQSLAKADSPTFANITSANITAGGKIASGFGATYVSINEAGAITVTRNYHRVRTFEGLSTDDLVTINGGVDGMFLVLKAEDDAMTIVLKNGTGNMVLAGGDFSLDDINNTIMLVYDGPATTWYEVSRSSNS